jgi:hypothetical protein
MYSHHDLSAAQEVLDVLIIKYPLWQLMTTLTSMKPTPPPISPATQDVPPTDTTTTALLETKG